MIHEVKKIKKKYIILFLIFALVSITPFTYSRYTSKYTKQIVISAIQTGYMVKFDANGGTGEMATQGFQYGTPQKLSKSTFTKEGYVFSNWNTAPDGTGTSYDDEQEIPNLTDVDGAIITLYAMYAREKYTLPGETVFDGKTSIVNTEICLFNEENINKDFEVSFEIIERGTENTGYTSGNYPTIMSAMNEKGEPWPGMVYRIFNDWDDQLVINVSSTDSLNDRFHLPAGRQKVTFKRINKAIYLSLNDEPDVQLIDVSAMPTFDYPVVFGAGLDGNMNPQRWFQGTLSNLKVVVTDSNPNIGTITYDPNEGEGNKLSQHVLADTSYTLRKNTYIRAGYIFTGWNTQANGLGTPYTDEQEVDNLVGRGERITLYAQWEKYNYRVKFDINGGTSGTMDLQEFESATPQNLSQSTFQKEGYSFGFWNTKADGSGVSYEDGESVLNLTTRDETVTLYAMYEQFSYHVDGDLIFDETDRYNGKRYIDTSIYLFSRKNAAKDFVISFTINSYVNHMDFDTIVSSLDESGTPYPGFVFRINNKPKNVNEYVYELEANAATSKETVNYYALGTPKTVVIKRTGGILYLQLDGGEEMRILDYSSFNKNFYYPLTVGASLDVDFVPWRYFTGTISDLDIQLSE